MFNTATNLAGKSTVAISKPVLIDRIPPIAKDSANFDVGGSILTSTSAVTAK